ncbi:hypothetical protein ACFV2Q_37765 [Streptomyces sp. NPDC059650]|uniref:hypothetical protein n=1 Tax=Streptomyces sp. NPDC059650 TaxID=3346896 RepID=UPI0036CB00C2
MRGRRVLVRPAAHTGRYGGSGCARATAEVAGPALTPVFLLVSAVTGGTTLRAAARVFLGAGPPAAGVR